MTVFPLRRSVGFKAATASSRYVRPQSSVTHPLDDLTQLGTIGLDNEVDRQALTGTLVHFLAEVCPRSRPFRKDSAEVAKRKKGG